MSKRTFDEFKNSQLELQSLREILDHDGNPINFDDSADELSDTESVALSTDDLSDNISNEPSNYYSEEEDQPDSFIISPITNRYRPFVTHFKFQEYNKKYFKKHPDFYGPTTVMHMPAAGPAGDQESQLFKVSIRRESKRIRNIFKGNSYINEVSAQNNDIETDNDFFSDVENESNSDADMDYCEINSENDSENELEEEDEDLEKGDPDELVYFTWNIHVHPLEISEQERERESEFGVMKMFTYRHMDSSKKPPLFSGYKHSRGRFGNGPDNSKLSLMELVKNLLTSGELDLYSFVAIHSFNQYLKDVVKDDEDVPERLKVFRNKISEFCEHCEEVSRPYRIRQFF